MLTPVHHILKPSGEINVVADQCLVVQWIENGVYLRAGMYTALEERCNWKQHDLYLVE